MNCPGCGRWLNAAGAAHDCTPSPYFDMSSMPINTSGPWNQSLAELDRLRAENERLTKQSELRGAGLNASEAEIGRLRARIAELEEGMAASENLRREVNERIDRANATTNALRTALAAAQQDSERLDWLADSENEDYDRALSAIRNCDPGDRQGLRAAIDAARGQG